MAAQRCAGIARSPGLPFISSFVASHAFTAFTLVPDMHAKSNFALGFAALLCGGAAIGFAGILVRLSDVSPLASAFWRMVLAAPVPWSWAWSVRVRDRRDG